jgi:hypothetical protein
MICDFCPSFGPGRVLVLSAAEHCQRSVFRFSRARPEIWSPAQILFCPIFLHFAQDSAKAQCSRGPPSVRGGASPREPGHQQRVFAAQALGSSWA